MQIRSVKLTFPYDSNLARPMTVDQMAELIGKCASTYQNLTDWTDGWGMLFHCTSIKGLKAATDERFGIKLDRIDEAEGPVPTATPGKECVRVVEQFLEQRHPDAWFSFKTVCKLKGYVEKQLFLDLDVHAQRLHVFVGLLREERQWFEQVSRMFDPGAVVVEREGRLAFEYSSAGDFYERRNPTTGVINGLGLSFKANEVESALAKYNEICGLPGVKVVKSRNPFVPEKAEHYWSLACPPHRPGNGKAEDDLRALESIGLILSPASIRYKWKLARWEAWRDLARLPLGVGIDPYPQSPLFSFKAGTGGEVLLQVVVTRSGKFQPWICTTQKSDLEPAFNELGLKVQSGKPILNW